MIDHLVGRESRFIPYLDGLVHESKLRKTGYTIASTDVLAQKYRHKLHLRQHLCHLLHYATRYAMKATTASDRSVGSLARLAIPTLEWLVRRESDTSLAKERTGEERGRLPAVEKVRIKTLLSAIRCAMKGSSGSARFAGKLLALRRFQTSAVPSVPRTAWF